MEDYSKMTQDDFDRILYEIVRDAGVSELFQLPGVYEIVAEYYNNLVLAAWEQEQSVFEEDEVTGENAN
jgi:hypothetical protein